MTAPLPNRRSVMRAGAWSLPAVAVAAASPAFAGSSDRGLLTVTGFRTVAGLPVDPEVEGPVMTEAQWKSMYRPRSEAAGSWADGSMTVSATNGRWGTQPSHWNVVESNWNRLNREAVSVTYSGTVSRTYTAGAAISGGNFFRYTSVVGSSWSRRTAALNLTVTNAGTQTMTEVMVSLFVPTVGAQALGGYPYPVTALEDSMFAFAGAAAVANTPFAAVVPAGVQGRVLNFRLNGDLRAAHASLLHHDISQVAAGNVWNQGYVRPNPDTADGVYAALHPSAVHRAMPAFLKASPFDFASGQEHLLHPWAMVSGRIAEAGTSTFSSPPARLPYRDLRAYSASMPPLVTPAP